MIDFVRFRKWFYLITVGVMVVSVVALAAPPRLPWGLEFSSGTSLTIDFVDPDEQIDSDEVQDRLLALGLEKAIVQKTGDNGFFIRTTVVEDDLVPFLEGQFGPVKVLNYDGVTDLAEVITFIDPVPMAALRDAFEGDDVEGFVTREAPGGIFISAQGISGDKVEDALAVIEEDYGATDRTSFDSEGDMALMLDFGPAAVASKDFEQALADIGEGFSFVKSGLNSFTVVSPSVTQGVRDSLASNLQNLFGLARETTFEDSEDLVTFLNSEQKIDENDLRNELNFQGFSHVDAVPVGETSYLLVAENIPEDSQDELLEALRDRFEGVIPEQFNFAEGLAVTLDFGLPAEFDNVEIEVARLNPRALVASVGDRYFVGAKGVSEEDKTTLISGLEEVFGLIEHSSFDFAKGVAFTLAFVDPVTLDDLIGSLAIIPVRDALSKGVKVRLSGPRTFDLIGILLPRENQEDVLGDVERRIGSLEISRYDAEMDLAIALNFGGEVTLDDLSVEIAQRAPALEVEAIEGTSFILWGSEFDQQQLDPLLSELEAIFGGRVRDVSLAGPTHMAEVVSFDPPVKLAEVQDVLFKEQIKDVVVLPIGDKGFFIAGENVPENKQSALLSAMSEISDSMDSRPYDFTAGIAVTLDFGEVVDEAGLRDSIAEQGFSNISVVPAGLRGFFIGAKDMAATAREDLVEELETLFGLAERTSFSGDDDMAVRVRVADPVAALEKVNETLLVQKMGPNRFLLAASGMPEEDQGFLFATVQQAFGDIGQTRYNFSTDLATTITFSEPIQPISEASVRSALEDRGYTGLVMVDQGDDTFFLRGARPSGDQKGKIINTLEATFGEINPESIEFSFVDAEIARRSVVNTFIAVLGGSVGILLYVWWAFRRTPKPFRFGVAAVIGLVHDAVVVLGAFGLMAKFRGVEIDSLLVIGLLAVIGYSVNNTIVVLDRIRENVARNPGRDFDASVNFSLNETLSRNLNTALTTGVAILAVALFGGGTIFNFMLVLLIGVGAGTYSSLFLAANVLVSWDKGEIGSVFRLPWIRRREVAQR